MTFSESGHGLDVQASKTLPELETELSAIQSERTQLNQDVKGQWADIPEPAFTYIATHCPRPELMALAISEVRLLQSEDPTALDDPEIMPFLLNDCLEKAQYASKEQRLNEVSETEHKLLSTKAVLADITKHTANLKGRAKLDAARECLNGPDVPEAVRLELIRKFDLVAATLDQMSSVFTDETSQTEFEAIVNSASFDFIASDVTTTFAPILNQVEASDTFSNAQKMKLRQIVTGSDIQKSLRDTFTDENGVAQPRFTQKHVNGGVKTYQMAV